MSTLITNAFVFDGTGADGFHANLLIEQGVITAIVRSGTTEHVAVENVIDAAGMVVCPGFIDVHSHADHAALLSEDDLAKIRQGITTEIVGNCGQSLAPIAHGAEDEFWDEFRPLFDCAYLGWHKPSEFFEILDRHPGVTNSCPLVGHGALRMAVLGTSSSPSTPGDMAAMGWLLRDALDAGAFGLSTGLLYPPGMYGTTEELVALARQLPAGRIYATHIRDEGDKLLPSIQEALTVGKHADCRVQISHLKAAGSHNWGAVKHALEAIDASRQDGLLVSQDVYPYDAASTALSACLPPWAHDGGSATTLAILRDPAALARLRRDVHGQAGGDWENIVAGAGGYDRLLVCSTASDRFVGRTILELSDELGLEPFDTLAHVLREERLHAEMVVFDMSEDDVDTVLCSPFTMIGSDGGVAAAGDGQHPRLFGTFPRVLGRYVRERQVLQLSEAIRRMTSLASATFGVPNRGEVAVGKAADLVCFDPETVGHPGDFRQPSAHPKGIVWVMQSGTVTVKAGQWQGIRMGRRLAPTT